jgi:hypothetical protein
MKSNGALLHRKDATVGNLITTVGVAFTIASSMLWVCTAGLRSTAGPATVAWSFLAMAAVLVANFVIALTAIRTCFAGPDSAADGTNYSGIAGVTQDQLMVSLLMLVLTWLPSLIIVHVPVGTPERWTSIVLILYSFMFLISTVFFWVLRYNTRHGAYNRHRLTGTFDSWPSNQRFPLVPWTRFPNGLKIVFRLRAQGISNEQWVDLLEDHIVTQNTIAMLYVFMPGITLIPFLNEMRVATPD